MNGSLLFRLALVLWGTMVTASVHAATTIAAANGDIIITPLVHSSVQLEYQDLVIQVDPWSAISLGNYKTADIILVTDSQGHHLDPKAIDALRRPNTTVIAPANSRDRLGDAVIMANGESLRIQGVDIEAIAAYDIVPGPPEHPRGDANGYVVTLGGKRILLAGVTECVDEVASLRDIDVAFMPLNIPPARMTPADSAACTRRLNPDVVYTYHYDQDYARRVGNPDAASTTLPGGLTIAESITAFAQALAGSGIEYRQGNWYPPRFVLDDDWPSLPLGQRWLTGGIGGMCIGNDDRVVLLNRQNVVEEDLDAAQLAPPIVTLDFEGNTVNGWGDNESFGGRLHDCHANDDGSLWIVPAATGHIQHWSADGELLMQIGTSGAYDSSDGTRSGEPLNSDRPQFFLPAAVDVDESNGDIYVADGELPGGNSRIAVFNEAGQFLRQWSLHRNTGENDIELPHCLRLSNDGLVYVCDRRADRIQVFDKQGKLLQTLTAPHSPLSPADNRTSGTRGDAVVLDFSKDAEQQFLYVINQNSVTVEVLDRKSGEWITRFGEGPGRYPGQFELPHGIAVDSEGNVYVAEQEGRRVQRFLLRN
jgi:L-ascorbate metabolism protein UlaG (beta-lactamase superfamily)